MKKLMHKTFIILFIFTLAACSNSKDSGDSAQTDLQELKRIKQELDDTKAEAMDAIEALENYGSEQTEVLVEKIQAQLDQMDRDLDKMQTKASNLGDSAKTGYIQSIETARAKRKVMETQLNELKNASEEAWVEVYKGFKEAWSDLETSFAAAQKKLAENGAS